MTGGENNMRFDELEIKIKENIKWKFIDKEQGETFYYSETVSLLKKNLTEFDLWVIERY